MIDFKINTKQLQKFAKIIGFNLVPIIGLIFLDWGIFELAVTYLLETAVTFFIFSFDHFIINKKSRYPFIYGIIFMFFLMLPFLGLVYGWLILAYTMTHPDFATTQAMFSSLESFIRDFDIYWIIGTFLMIETIFYLLKNANGRKDKSSTIWHNLKRFLFIHLFVVSSAFIFSYVPHNNITALFFIIAFKIMLDYVLENEKTMDKIDRLLSKFATLGLNDDGTARLEDEE